MIKPIVFGNKSQYFGKKRESDGHTHWWQVYVKPYNENEVIFLFLILQSFCKIITSFTCNVIKLY